MDVIILGHMMVDGKFVDAFRICCGSIRKQWDISG